MVFSSRFLGLKLTTFLSSKFNKLAVVIICILLYVIGSIETYSAYLGPSTLLDIYGMYKHYFFTTRNGLFYAPIYICLGQLGAEYRHSPFLSSRPLVKLLVSFFLLLVEGTLIYFNQGDDKNFFLSLVPFTLFLFNWASRTTVFRHKNWKKLKQYSVAYFFFHPIFIEIGFYALAPFHWPIWQRGLLVSVFALLLTHGVAVVYYLSVSEKDE